MHIIIMPWRSRGSTNYYPYTFVTYTETADAAEALAGRMRDAMVADGADVRFPAVIYGPGAQQIPDFVQALADWGAASRITDEDRTLQGLAMMAGRASGG